MAPPRRPWAPHSQLSSRPDPSGSREPNWNNIQTCKKRTKVMGSLLISLGPAASWAQAPGPWGETGSRGRRQPP